ncbi:MAG: UPF0175 family protein [Chloroflexota bacterium]
MQTVTISMSDKLMGQLEPSDKHIDSTLQADLCELRLAQSLTLYKQGNISEWKAARLAGVTLREMIQYLAMNGIKPEVTDDMIEELR